MVPIIPQTIPPFVVPAPNGSICPEVILAESFFPIIQAGIPKAIATGMGMDVKQHMSETKILKIPNTRIRVPRWGVWVAGCSEDCRTIDFLQVGHSIV